MGGWGREGGWRICALTFLSSFLVQTSLSFIRSATPIRSVYIYISAASPVSVIAFPIRPSRLLFEMSASAARLFFAVVVVVVVVVAVLSSFSLSLSLSSSPSYLMSLSVSEKIS